MKHGGGEKPAMRDRAHELRRELARKIALFVGSAENRATEIPALTLHRRTAPTARCSMTYLPSVTVIAQGRKRVELGRNVFIYDASRFLLTSVDLPVVSRVIEASEQAPCLALSLKLEMPVVRELLSRAEIQEAEAPSDSPGMATGETTVEFLGACCRLVDLLATPQDIPFHRSHSAGDRVPDSAQRGGSASTRDCDAGRAEPPDGESDRLDQRELCEAPPGGRARGNRWHGRVDTAPSLPGADRDESPSVSEAASVAGGARTHAHGWFGRGKRGLRGRVRKRQPVQS